MYIAQTYTQNIHTQKTNSLKKKAGNSKLVAGWELLFRLLLSLWECQKVLPEPHLAHQAPCLCGKILRRVSGHLLLCEPTLWRTVRWNSLSITFLLLGVFWFFCTFWDKVSCSLDWQNSMTLFLKTRNKTKPKPGIVVHTPLNPSTQRDRGKWISVPLRPALFTQWVPR